MTLLGNFLLGSEVSDIRTALRIGDRLFIGKPGQTHLGLIDTYLPEIEELLSTVGDLDIEDGFVNDQDEWIPKTELRQYTEQSPLYEESISGDSADIGHSRRKKNLYKSFGEWLQDMRAYMGWSQEADINTDTPMYGTEITQYGKETSWTRENVDTWLGKPPGTMESWETGQALPTDEDLRLLEGLDFEDFEIMREMRDRESS